MIKTTKEVYECVQVVTRKCREHGYNDIVQRLDNAMHLGSSGLEILGAIKWVFVSEMARLEGAVDKDKLNDVIQYVNRAFGID
jgi:hypothetical protein